MFILKRNALRELAKQPCAQNANCRIRATNDIEALERWLDEYFDKPTTFRTYKKEGERFLVWCVLVRETRLSTLGRDDVEAYIDFIKDPQPREMWCGPRRKKAEEGEHAWYPFAGPLSGAAIRTALASLNSLLSFLVDANYLEFNPFSLVRRKSRFKQKLDDHALSVQERILSEEEWQAFLTTLDDEAEDSQKAKFKKNRLRFIISMLFLLGLRIEELAAARWQDCKKLNGKWWFFVCGKNDRLGKIPINAELLQAMMTFRHAQGLAPLPESHEETPLVSSFGGDQHALTSRQMGGIIKELALKAAARFPSGSHSYEKLKRLSPHWLRHLCASRQDLAGISITNIKSNLRHQSEQTTRIYIHAYDDERHREMEKLKFK